jgi:hypothetical protein
MPAYQGTPQFVLSKKYRLKAIGCEQQAEHATDQTTEQVWRQLAAQWQSMADEAAALSSASLFDLFR